MTSISSFFSTHLYFTSILMLIPFWVVLFFTKKESRTEMVTMGIYLGIAGLLLSTISLRDYWHPIFVFESFHIEEFLYGFFFGGLSTELAKLFLKNKYKKHPERHIFLFLTLLISYFLLKITISDLHINSIYAYCLVLLFIGSTCYVLDRKVLKLQIFSGALALIITFIIFHIAFLINPDFIKSTWELNNISALLVSGIPIEELMFAFLLGFGASSYYETYKGIDAM